MSSSATPRYRTRRLVAAACVIGIAGCGDLFGPPAPPAVYALASIAGVTVDSTVDFLPMCMPTLAEEGRELRFLGDTIWIHPGGRMVHRTYQRSLTGDMSAGDTSRYLRIGREVFSFGDRFSARFTIEDDGLLQREGWCGPWRYDRVVASR